MTDHRILTIIAKYTPIGEQVASAHVSSMIKRNGEGTEGAGHIVTICARHPEIFIISERTRGKQHYSVPITRIAEIPEPVQPEQRDDRHAWEGPAYSHGSNVEQPRVRVTLPGPLSLTSARP